ncbi:(d)CMP kinase [Desulforhabdus amnigena]|jgi:cytidylate kinase|uniref:Cytidylate kinase n=1 Tax=Desulforhabdus amnigena TaxID=40218 RepID=A0A9W6FUD6_9BACT|nr:(d)CMP kinase [Desulforhabdus amnigena]NLJ27522.1 (d)CMP kinase [Deltaproteobacteria bacterium]GLI35043.1 cytidylate kinase [Desulforhabdus amnigena]
MIIAIDGPAGAGKSTVCRLLAKELGYVYLDTGAMYRALAWALLEEGLTCKEESQWAKYLPDLSLRFAIKEGVLTISYRGKPLDEELRQPEIAQKASRISQSASVRTFLTHWQRTLALDGRIVAEGRDMGTVVFPYAPVKVFLTADLATRTKRRMAQYLEKGISVEYSALEAQIRERDEADQKRALAPLKPAQGALLLDTSGMDISGVMTRLLEFVLEKTGPGKK